MSDSELLVPAGSTARGAEEHAVWSAEGAMVSVRWLVEAASQAAEQLAVVAGVLSHEARLASQQLHGQRVRHHHDHHGDVEGHQWAEHPEGAVVDHTQLRLWHDVERIVQSCP